MKCPRCHNQTRFVIHSTGGDGLYECKCGWVEDPTKIYEHTD